jgi:hypothetical protein
MGISGGNRFVKGIISDLPNIDVSNQHWVFPSVNVRITLQGSVFIAKPVNGNEVLFTVPTGYQIIGAEEYFDILYLVLYKDDGTIELGSYPHYDGATKTYSYRALQCLGSIATPLPFNTSALSFDGSTVDIICAESYDDTVDLYLNQVGTPTVKINSNMNTEGTQSNFIVETDLPYIAHLISDASKPMIVDSVELKQGGKLEPGKYILFLRYSSKDFNKTTFLTESSPFDVHGTVNSLYKAGSFLLDDAETEFVNAKIELTIEDGTLDDAFTYYQVAVLIASGNPNEIATYKTYLISQYIPTTQTKVVIDGYESRETLSLDEIAAISFIDNINKSQTVIDNRYVGANWESEGYDKIELKNLAELIKTDGVVETPLSILEGGVTKEPTYYPGEIYPFGVTFRFTDGRETESFPITGHDYVADPEIDLEKGLVRMPLKGLDNNELPNFGLKLDLTLLKTALESVELDYISGYTIVRGERIKNILANGVTRGMIDNISFPDLATYDAGSMADLYGDVINEYFYSKTEEGSLAVPDFFEGYYPMYKDQIEAGDKIGFRVNTSDDPSECWPLQATPLINRIALYSPDISLSNEFDNMDLENVYISQTGAAVLNKIELVDESLTNYSYDSGLSEFVKLFTHYQYTNETIQTLVSNAFTINGVYVQKGSKRVSGLFSSFFPDYYINTDTPLTRQRYVNFEKLWGVRTRSGLFGSYIGLSSENDISSLIDKPVVLTRYENSTAYLASALDNFQIRNTTYGKVSQFITKAEVSTINVFNGDSYVGRVYLRGVKWFGAKGLYEIAVIGGEKFSYHHGTMISFNCFSGVNFHMRGEVESTDPGGSEGKYTFWPRASLRNSMEGWNITSSNEEDMHESNSINEGYNKSLSLKPYIGYDDIAPASSSKYPGRLRSSAVRVKGAFYDGFKTFYTNDKVDIPENGGPIVGIYNLLEMLIVVQHKSISRVYTDVRQVDSQGSFDIVTGSSQSFLYDKNFVMSDYGAISRDHVLSTGNNVYGIDVINRVLWIASMTSTPERKQTTGVQDLGKEKLVTKYIFDLLTFLKESAPDYTIALGYDKFNLEVLYTFKWADQDNVYGESVVYNGYNYITLVFSEAMGAFTGLYSIPADRYTKFKTNLVSISNNAYIHKRDSTQMNFFGDDYSMILSWIVNNAGEDAPPLVKKFFEAVIISCPEIPFKNIKFSTDSQSSALDPFINEDKFWQTPRYNEFQYEISIPTNTSEVDNAIFEVDSVMKGFWLKITVEYEGTDDFYMIHSDTLFNPINY